MQCAVSLTEHWRQWRRRSASPPTYIRRLRAQLAAATRDNGEFVAAALRDKLAQQQQQPLLAPVAQAPAQRLPILGFCLFVPM